MSVIRMTVVLDEAHLGREGEVCASIEAIGVRVERVLPGIGVITGRGEEGLLGPLRALDGIEEARPEGAVRLPPLSERVPQ